jgi:hypothetical protein
MRPTSFRLEPLLASAFPLPPTSLSPSFRRVTEKVMAATQHIQAAASAVKHKAPIVRFFPSQLPFLASAVRSSLPFPFLVRSR